MRIKTKLTEGQKLELRRNPPKLLTRIEAAVVSTLSLRTISDEITSGRLKSLRAGDRRIIKIEDLMEFLAQQEPKAVNDQP